MTVPIIVMANGVEILVTAYDDNSVTFIVPSGAVSGLITIKIGTCVYNVNLNMNVVKPGPGEGVHVVTYTDYRWRKISSIQYHVDVLYYDYKYVADSDTYNNISVYKVEHMVKKYIENIVIHVHKYNVTKQIKRIP